MLVYAKVKESRYEKFDGIDTNHRKPQKEISKKEL